MTQDPDAIRVLDGRGVHYMTRALKRISCAFEVITALNAESLSRCQVLILCGNAPSVGLRRAKTLQGFLEGGGAVLAVGGGATTMIDIGLFDATGYYPTGTSIHQSTFDGYHRLTFGYPGARPEADWAMGVPMLVRATEGPLMELGPEATSVLTYGRPFSAVAFQPVGRGIALLIGPDPQGGRVYHEVDAWRVSTGEELKTDAFLANAIAFLSDRACNIIPNAGFEEHMDLEPQHSNWDAQTAGEGRWDWCRERAPEGTAFIKVVCPNEGSSVTLRPHCPLVVERGATYTFGCQYRSSADWDVTYAALHGSPQEPDEQPLTSMSIPRSEDWNQVEGVLAVPDSVSYVQLSCRVSGTGELCLDDLALRRAAG